MAQQEKRCIRKYQEYPGSTVWADYEYKCPECNEFRQDVGRVSTTDEDGNEHYLCECCGEKVLAEEGFLPKS